MKKPTKKKSAQTKVKTAQVVDVPVNNTDGAKMPNPMARHRGSPRKDIRLAFSEI